MIDKSSLYLDAKISDVDSPRRCVQREATFYLSIGNAGDKAIVQAILVGKPGERLTVHAVTRNDLNLTPKRSKQLAQAIYEGHYEINDHARPVRQSRLTGELNIEPYWENVIREKFIV